MGACAIAICCVCAGLTGLINKWVMKVVLVPLSVAGVLGVVSPCVRGKPVVRELRRIKCSSGHLVVYEVNPAAFASMRVQVRYERYMGCGVLCVYDLIEDVANDAVVTCESAVTATVILLRQGQQVKDGRRVSVTLPE